MRLLCPAKINLHLRVGPRRDDGFHSLLSWFCTVGLFDTLILKPAPLRAVEEGSFIPLTCDQVDLPTDRRNLVVKIGDAWAQEVRGAGSVEVVPVETELQKRIPAGAGLGGGSSDAARMLLGLNKLWRADRDVNSLSGFAARFGSDLPFFLFGPSSVCKGRGEIVAPVQRPKAGYVVLMLPPIHMPTADVYRKFDALKLGRMADIESEPQWSDWAQLDARSLLDRLVNDLEPAAFSISPALAELRDEAEALLNRPVRMSGSGSSLFTLYDTVNEAELAQVNLQLAGWPRVEVVQLAPDFLDDLNKNRP